MAADVTTDATTGATTGAIPVDVLGARICALASRIAQATYHYLVMVAEFDEREGWTGVGIKSCAHWLAWTCSLAPGTAREHVRVARALADLPLVSTEMAAGRLSYAKVREVTRVADRVAEPELVDLARTATASQLTRAIRGFRLADGDRGPQEDRRTASWHTDDDGSVVLAVRLPAEEGAAVIAALNAARDDVIRENRSHDDVRGSAAPGPVDPADTVLQWARGYLAATPEDRSGEDRTTVVVHVNAEHLDPEKRSRGNASARSAIPVDCCQVDGVGGVERDTAARLACDATLIGVIRGAGGSVLAHGRRRRTVSQAQRRTLRIRDGGCQFPSCQRVSHLEAHHVTPWSLGGPTDLDNLILLCRFHHMSCHEGGVQLTERGDNADAGTDPGAVPGRLRWRFTTAQGEPLLGERFPDGRPGWKSDVWILWHCLDGSKGWRDPAANRIRPLWAGERFSLVDTVSMLFGAGKGRGTAMAA